MAKKHLKKAKKLSATKTLGGSFVGKK